MRNNFFFNYEKGSLTTTTNSANKLPTFMSWVSDIISLVCSSIVNPVLNPFFITEHLEYIVSIKYFFSFSGKNHQNCAEALESAGSYATWPIYLILGITRNSVCSTISMLYFFPFLLGHPALLGDK